MKKIITFFVLVVFTIACKNDQAKNKDLETEIPTIALADFDAKAGEYVDKEIQVEGIVDHVCKHGGKKLFLVDDNGEVHIESENRFDDALKGSSVLVKGIVREFKVDESYCLKEEENYIQNHKKGVDADSVYAQKMETINYYRDSMKTAGVDHLSYYSIEFVSLEVKK